MIQFIRFLYTTKILDTNPATLSGYLRDFPIEMVLHQRGKFFKVGMRVVWLDGMNSPIIKPLSSVWQLSPGHTRPVGPAGSGDQPSDWLLALSSSHY